MDHQGTGVSLPEIWFAFIAGLAGSGHCIGMCGTIVTALGMTRRNESFSGRVAFHVLYNLGRITTYTLLGVTAGMAGASLNLLAMKSVATWVSFAANLFVITIGFSSAFGMSWFNFSLLDKPPAELLAGPFRRAAGSSTPAPFFLGLMFGFLPCGLIYAPLVAAAGSGNPLVAGGMMAALGFGTMPLLFLFGSASTALSAQLRDRLLRIAGLAVAMMGMTGLWRVLVKMISLLRVLTG